MLPVTSLVASLAAVALVVLSISVSLRRMQVGVRIGFGDDPALMRRIRAQGNFVEYVPLVLILLAIAEYRSVSVTVLWILAALLVVGRGLHVAGILAGSTPIRAPGMICTYSALLLGAGALLLG